MRNKKTFWENNGHHFILVAMGIFIVLSGYGVGRLVFRPEANNKPPVETPQEKPVEPVETPVGEIPAETPQEPGTQEPEEEPGENTDIRTETETEREPIDYKNTQVEDATLESGQTKVVQEGSLGEKLYIYEVTYDGDKEIDRVLIKEEILKEPQDRITNVGTKKAPTVTTKTVEEKKTIPFATLYEEDDTQYVGYVQTKTAGANGEKVLTVKITYQNGVEKSRQVIGEKITRQSVNEIIVTGTKPLDEGDVETPSEPEPIG